MPCPFARLLFRWLAGKTIGWKRRKTEAPKAFRRRRRLAFVADQVYRPMGGIRVSKRAAVRRWRKRKTRRAIEKATRRAQRGGRAR